MRGRKPRGVIINVHERYFLQQIAHSRGLPWYQVQHARTLLAMADGERVQVVAAQMQCDPSTVRRICRRYEQSGLQGILAEAPRTGHPADISPSGPRADRAAGLPRTYRQGVAHHPLE